VNRRVIGLFLVLLLLGAGAGYALAAAADTGPTRVAGPTPVTAVSPDVPTAAPREVLPDPIDEALGRDLPVETVTLQDGRRSPGVELALPTGWRESHIPRSRDWNYAVPGNSTNTYKLRITILKGTNVSVAAAKASRIVALRQAESEGNLLDFSIESENADTFIATYLDGGYLRVTMERFVELDDSELAYAVVAVTGRDRDRPGITDLVERTASSMVAVEAVTD
jgi:hypothetical protein